MMTMIETIDMMDRETITAISPNQRTTNDGQPRDNVDLLRIIQERMHNEPERGRLEKKILTVTNCIDRERSEDSPIVGKCEVVNKSDNDICIHNEETGIAIIEEEHRRSGEIPTPYSTPLGAPPNTNKGNMTGESEEQ
jgi:hypothetical protein